MEINHNELAKLMNIARSFCDQGKVATYIPALAKQNKDDLAISICMNDRMITAGEVDKKFTVQSISKVITLAIVLEEVGLNTVLEKVDMEATEYTFNSITSLKRNRKPINPMVNAGALTITSMISGQSIAHKMDKILNKFRIMTCNDTIDYDEEVAKSELEMAHINRALCYILKENDILYSNIEQLLTLYTMQCAIEINTNDLARIAMVLANGGKDPNTNKEIIPHDVNKIVNKVMYLCGMYNVSGEFALTVGFPAKSGVSGSLIGVVPGVMGIGIYGPSLNKYGNSIAGTKLLELLSKQYNLSLIK